MSSADFPRVLVVTSNNFNLVSGGGITLTNLFRGWPPDGLANLHQDPTLEDTSVCQLFYRLSSDEIRWTWPFSLAEELFDGKRHLRDRGQGITGSTQLQAGDRGGLKRGTVSRAVFGDGVPRTVRISGRLNEWIESFKPELLYAFLGSMAQIRLVHELSRRYRLPVAIHMMDDWPAVLYRRGLFGPVFRAIVQREFHALLQEAEVRMGICEEMCEDYQERYGIPFLPFHNAIDVEQWMPYARRDWKAGSSFVVRYVGSIVPDGQREALRDVCLAVINLRSSGKPVEMWVHAPTTQAAFLRQLDLTGNGFHLASSPAPEAIAHLLSGADLLVLPFNFDTRSARYIRLSMPTKVPAYMVSGTPVLVYGPPGIATVRYAQRGGWGHVLSTPGLAPLQETLLWLLEDRTARERLGKRAKVLAREHHDAGKVRPAFHSALVKAAAGNSIKKNITVL